MLLPHTRTRVSIGMTSCWDAFGTKCVMRVKLTSMIVFMRRTDEHGTRLHGSSSSVSGGSADLEEEEMFGDMDIDESNVVMRSIPVRSRAGAFVKVHRVSFWS